MDAEYRNLQRAERRGRETLLDPYGAGDPAEFFAVAVECFFDAPHDMRHEVEPREDVVAADGDALRTTLAAAALNELAGLNDLDDDELHTLNALLGRFVD